MKNIMYSCAIALLLFSIKTGAQTNDKQTAFNKSFDAYIHKTMGLIPELPAIAVVVIKDDQPVFVQAYGMADKEKRTKADTNTLFYIASSTKSFTALVAALLDKEGKIKLNDPLINYTKNINLKNPIPEKIIIRDLLTHTSGLNNDALAFRMAYSGQSDKKDMANVFAHATTCDETKIGTYDYDNLGYNIYAVLLQANMHANWQDLLQQKIFDPLGMKHTTAYISKTASKKWNVAAFYLAYGEKEFMRSWLDKTDENMQSAGGMFASITDIGSWLNMNMNNGKLNGKQIIPADIITACHTGYTKTIREQLPFAGNGAYGLGWQIGNYKDDKVIYHHGGFPGCRSHISFLPEKKLGVAVLINESFVGSGVADLLATYAYDWWLKDGNIEKDYATQLDDLVKAWEDRKAKIQKSFADRAKRVWQLSLPLEVYTGKYSNPDYGSMEILIEQNVLAVKMGNIHCVSTPFTDKETVRVEMIPGSGEVLKFKKNAEEKIEALEYSGATFEKEK